MKMILRSIKKGLIDDNYEITELKDLENLYKISKEKLIIDFENNEIYIYDDYFE